MVSPKIEVGPCRKLDEGKCRDLPSLEQDAQEQQGIEDRRLAGTVGARQETEPGR